MPDLKEMSKDERLERMRHSAAHIMAEVVMEMFPEGKLGIGPPIDTGFYYDFELPRALSTEDLPEIEAKMRARIESNVPFEPSAISKEEARRMFADQPFKIELIEGIEDEEVGLYKQAGFVDLCQGPHVSTTGQVPAFKLMSVAGAYWRGSEQNPMLQRIYGALFDSQEELDAHLEQIEEALRRDHRRLGKDLDLFSFHEEFGPGLVYWHPKGGRIRNLIEDFWREERAPRLLQREHVLADGHRRAGLLREADELPVPHPDIQERATQLSRTAHEDERAGHRVSL